MSVPICVSIFLTLIPLLPWSSCPGCLPTHSPPVKIFPEPRLVHHFPNPTCLRLPAAKRIKSKVQISVQSAVINSNLRSSSWTSLWTKRKSIPPHTPLPFLPSRSIDFHAVVAPCLRNYSQYPVINHHGKYKKECIYVYNRITLLCSTN